MKTTSKIADQLPAKIRKHDRESKSDESIQRGQKTDGQVEPVQATTITTIYNDCLERIFEFLDFESLLNVAGTCKRLQIAAAAKFGDDFGEKRVDIVGSDRVCVPIYKIHQSYITIKGLKICLPFLRHFGAKIRDLSIEVHNDRVHSYMSKYCADTLESITYYHKRSFAAEAFQKPFKSVKKVVLYRCELQNQFPNFVQWFPNIQDLSLVECSIGATAAHFPNLKHLTRLNVSIYHWCGNLTVEHVKNLLQSNQKLQRIELYTSVDMKLCTLLDMLNGNQSITNLKVSWISEKTFKDVTMADLYRFAVEHPLVVELDFSNYRFVVDDVINFIQRMNTLKIFRFLVNDHPECDSLLDQLDEEWKHKIKASQNGDSIEIRLNRQ